MYRAELHSCFAGWSKCWMKSMSRAATVSPAEPNLLPRQEKWVPLLRILSWRLDTLKSQREKAPGGTEPLPLLTYAPSTHKFWFCGHKGGPQSILLVQQHSASWSKSWCCEPATKGNSSCHRDSSQGSFSRENSCCFGKAKTNKLEQTTTESLIRPSLASFWAPRTTVISGFTEQAQKRALQQSFVFAA